MKVRNRNINNMFNQKCISQRTDDMAYEKLFHIKNLYFARRALKIDKHITPPTINLISTVSTCCVLPSLLTILRDTKLKKFSRANHVHS